jgi:two-component system LytT family sensor kinase
MPIVNDRRFGRSGIALFWLILAGVAVVQAAVSACVAPSTLTPNWWPLVERQFPPYLLWALLTPAIIRLARGVRGLRVARAAAIHVGCAIAVVVAMSFSRAFFHDLVVHALHNGHQINEWAAGGGLKLFELDLFIYAAIAAGATGFDAWREAAARRRREETLTMQLAQARLTALQMQMQPHFLFNTLNTVSALVERDPNQTRRVIARLSDLLRRVMDADEQESTLERELHFVRAYLEIEQVRFGDRLDFSFEIEPGLESVRVPTLVLQPLVENAIRHGIAPCPWKGRVDVRAFARDGQLVLEVCDTGPGPHKPASSPGNGLALQNTRQRLEELYAGAAALTLTEASGGGCIATIVLPGAARDLDGWAARDSSPPSAGSLADGRDGTLAKAG